LLKPQQGRVDCALVELQDTVTDLLDTPGDAKAMQWSHGIESFQYHEIECSLQYFGRLRHQPSIEMTKGG